MSLKRGDIFFKKVSPSNIDIHLFCKSYLPSHVSKSIYAVAFNSHNKTPDWVAYKLHAERTKLYNADTQQNMQRAGSEFYMDDELKSLGVSQAIPMTYNYNNEMLDPPSTTKLKYQKGHLIPAGDCKYAPEALDSSFSYINAAPQHSSLNAGKWNALERAIYDIAVILSEAVKIFAECESMPKEQSLTYINKAVEKIILFDEKRACITGELYTKIKSLGLSLGDRACLALSFHTGYPVITADKIWQKLDNTDINIILIR